MQARRDDARSGAGSERLSAPALSASIAALLGDLEATATRELDEPCASLDEELFAWDIDRLAHALRTLYAGGRDLRFAQLRPGLFTRLTGRHRAPLERFAAGVARMIGDAAAVKDEVGELEETWKEHEARVREALERLEERERGLAGQVVLGVTWLQRMCDAIDAQRAGGGNDRELATLAEAAQAYTQSFKRMQIVGGTARELVVRGQAILNRRAALLEQLHTGRECFETTWTDRMTGIAVQARAGRVDPARIPKAIAAHDDAMKRLEAVVDACGAVNYEEQLARQLLDQLREVIKDRRAAYPNSTATGW